MTVNEKRIRECIRHISTKPTGKNGYLAFWINGSLWASGRPKKTISVYLSLSGRSDRGSTKIFSANFKQKQSDIYIALAEKLESLGYVLA